MRYLVFIFSFIITSYSFAQDSTNTTKVETPKIVKKLSIGKTMQVGTVAVKFLEIVEDSRCPKNVSCVWAGQIVFLVEIFENGKLLEQKQITLNPKIPFAERVGNLFASTELSISGFSVMPYPEYKNTINPEAYYLQVGITNLN